MTSFTNRQAVAVSASLKAAHFPSPRGETLFDAVSWCVTDYYSKAMSGRPFEACGVVVIGESRQGKSTEINRLLERFNDGSVVMSDGRPEIFLRCMLSGKITWKDLGVRILQLLDYPLKGRRGQAEIWDLVIRAAELQGVVRIPFESASTSSPRKAGRPTCRSSTVSRPF